MKTLNLIITCEGCGEVRRFKAESEHQARIIFQDFRCSKGCEQSMHSYITITEIALEDYFPIHKKLVTAVV